MKAAFTPLIGRFGNQLFQYAYARAYAEQNGLELHTPRWIGEKIFQIEPTPEKQEGDLILGGYCQNQASLIYTRKQAREWFKLRPEIAQYNYEYCSLVDSVRAHRRTGDYVGYGYPIVSEKSYRNAAVKFWFNPKMIFFYSEYMPMTNPNLNGELSFLPDFFHLMNAPVLFRANSSFSFFAAVLADPSQQIFSPIVKHLPAGEHDCEFVRGNWPALSSRGDCTDLHMKEE